jgi:hypothetical protein
MGNYEDYIIMYQRNKLISIIKKNDSNSRKNEFECSFKLRLLNFLSYADFGYEFADYDI